VESLGCSSVSRGPTRSPRNRFTRPALANLLMTSSRKTRRRLLGATSIKCRRLSPLFVALSASNRRRPGKIIIRV